MHQYILVLHFRSAKMSEGVDALPDLILYVDQATSDKMDDETFNRIAGRLCEATAKALNLSSPKNVVVMQVTFTRGYNAPNMQILGIGSFSEERLGKLEAWKETLAGAVTELQEAEWTRDFLADTSVEVWPTMPFGKWAEVPKLRNSS